jgi:isoquinoline 1-oxidoreductase
MASLKVNGKSVDLATEAAHDHLLAVLRDRLGLIGAKPGCGEGACGACTVLADGEPVFSCQIPPGTAEGHSITTIEGLADGVTLHRVQRAFVEERASQCGYCTPAMVLRAAALLDRDPDPDDGAIAMALDANLCRCGSYPRILRAVRRAASRAATASTGQDPGDPVVEEGPPPRNLDSFRPIVPWDLCDPGDRDWRGALGDGLFVAFEPAADMPVPHDGSAWLHVDPSGTVTAFSGKVDVGQDNSTAFRLLVADELDVAPESVRVVLGDTDLCPYDWGTFASRSMTDSGHALRGASAAARQALTAARAGGEPTVNANRTIVVTEEPPLRSPSEWRFAGKVGHAAHRTDAVTGERCYVSDLHLPGLLHGAVLHPPKPSDVLADLDSSALSDVPGAVLVQEGDFVGVLAPDRATAQRAVAALRPRWRAEPDSSSADAGPTGQEELVAHLRSHPADGPSAWEQPFEEVQGDVGAALATALSSGGDRHDATYTTAYIAHTPLETRAALAEIDGETSRVTIRVGTQTPFRVRSDVALALGLDERDVRVIVPPTGGAFGGKHGSVVALEAALLARASGGRPVKVHWSRADEMSAGTLRPMGVVDVRAARDAAGALTAFELVDLNAGTAGLAFPYRCENVRLAYQPASSPLRRGSYRALAATANTFARESHLDEMAWAAGEDPLEWRLGLVADDSLGDVLTAAGAGFGWGDQSPRRKGHGRGLAAGVEKGGRVATCAEVVVDEDGIRVTRLVTAYECGAVVNPDTVVAQIEGGTLMALGGALYEEILPEDGVVANPTLTRYRVPRFSDMPELEVILLQRPDRGPAGAGETPLIAVAPAIANAVRDACGERLRTLPLTPALAAARNLKSPVVVDGEREV